MEWFPHSCFLLQDEDEYAEEEGEEETQSVTKTSMPAVDPEAASTMAEIALVKEERPSAMGIIGGPEDDLTVRAYLYGVLFQSYADKVGFHLYVSLVI